MTNNSLSAQNAAFQNGIQHGHTLLHDYSNESHYNYAVSTLGGLAYLKKNYPLVHDLFEDARKQHLLGPKKTTATDTPESEVGFSDSMRVDAITYDTTNVISTMSADFIKIKPTIAISANLKDKTTNQYVDVINICGDDDIHTLDGLIKKAVSELIHSDDREFETLCNFFWMEEQSDGTPVMASSTTKYNDFKVIGTKNIVQDFVVNDPIAKKKLSRDNVVVVYNRNAEVNDDYDYSYDNNKFNDKGSDWVKIYLPVSGTVTLVNDFIVLGLNEQMGFNLQITDLNNGVVNYYSNYDSIACNISDNKHSITWKFKGKDEDDYWNNYLNVSNFDAKTKVNIYCKIELNIQKVSTGMQMHIPVVFQSKGTPSGDKSCIISKPIMIQWGCLGKDTRILMADHTQKLVSEIKVGEFVLNDKQKPVQIKDIFYGNEEKMIQIITDDGKTALVSSGHPVCTDKGAFAAKNLTAGSKIQTVDGIKAISNLLYVDYNDRVYSLYFGTENNIFCNGILMGDFSAQQTVLEPNKPKEPIARSEKCIAARNQFRQLMNDLAEKNRVA
jgi:hypothetical protein